MVFVSFAGPDRQLANEFHDALAQRGVHAFIDERGIAPGEDILGAINDAIDQSDYFVLLWSESAASRPWVELEWTAALARDLNQNEQRDPAVLGRQLTNRRTFLFIVRVDDTPLPTIIATRRYLDARGGVARVAETLAATWRGDRDARVPVLPAPGVEASGGRAGTDEPTIELKIHNCDFDVAHVHRTAESTTGADLMAQVRKVLELPSDLRPEGTVNVGLRFRYRLVRHGIPLSEGPLAAKSLTALHLADGNSVDLEVIAEAFGPTGQFGRTLYRYETAARDHESVVLSPALRKTLENKAFGHLRPWRHRP